MIGRYAVLLASYFVKTESWNKSTGSAPKSLAIVGMSFRDLSETYHILLQIGLSCKTPHLHHLVAPSPTPFHFPLSFIISAPNRSHMHGMNFFLGLNALNFAEADRPFNRLNQSKRAEMYFTMGLCSHYTFPYSSSLPMVLPIL